MASIERTVSRTTVEQGESRSDGDRVPRLSERGTEELIFGLVGPVGSGCSMTGSILKEVLERDYGYTVHVYKLSEIINESASKVEERVPDSMGESASSRTERLQRTGDKLRAQYGDNYLAAKAIERIAQLRERIGLGETATGKTPIKLRHAHIIDSLKHPEELRLLRRTYGEIFWLFGVFAPIAVRERRLHLQEGHDAKQIGEIVSRDYREEDDHGQDVRGLFHRADFFIRNDQDNTRGLVDNIVRFVEVLFGFPVHTPTKDESAMYAAFAEAGKSACLSRQVGASIVSDKGELIGLGRNDVPVYGGGLYAGGIAAVDNRCHAWMGKNCHNDKKKEDLYRQIFQRLSAAGKLAEGVSSDSVKKELMKTDVRALIEYSRAVHAEMDAITFVARTNKPGIQGGTLYSTTFPCHSCARHIVASGISAVVFIEPYPKSLAVELHSDSVSESEADIGKKVVFLQYTGIAPNNVLKLFNGESRRKDDSGQLIAFDKKKAAPVVFVSLDDYASHEFMVVAELADNEQKRAAGGQATLPLAR